MLVGGEPWMMFTRPFDSDFSLWPTDFRLEGTPTVDKARIYSLSTSAAFPEVYIEISGIHAITKDILFIQHDGTLGVPTPTILDKPLTIKQPISLSSGEVRSGAFKNPYF